jgi:hypothetical protein
MHHPRQIATFLVLAAAVLLPAASSWASVELSINVTTVNFYYNESLGGSLYDSTSIGGGNRELPADYVNATRVSSIDFFLGGELQGRLKSSDKPYVDFLFQGIHNIPVGGGVVSTTTSGAGFGFDLLSPSLGGRFLALDIDTVDVTYVRNDSGGMIQFSFIANGPSAQVVMQNLPFGLSIDEGQPITVRVSSTKLTSITSAGGFLTGFYATNGTADVLATQVPEPVSFVVLMALSVAAWEISIRLRGRRAKK